MRNWLGRERHQRENRMIENYLAVIAVASVSLLLTYRIVCLPTADDRLTIALIHLLVGILAYMGA